MWATPDQTIKTRDNIQSKNTFIGPPKLNEVWYDDYATKEPRGHPSPLSSWFLTNPINKEKKPLDLTITSLPEKKSIAILC